MRHTKKFVAMAMASAMVLAACGGDDGESSDTTAAGGEGGSGESILDGAIECNQQHAGKEVTVFSPVRDSDTDTPIADYVAAYKPLEDCTGLKIVWQGTDQFETEINVRLEGGDAPDVIDFPQPGLMASLVAKGYLFELDEDLANRVDNDFFAGWDVYSKVDGKVYGIPGRSNIKSLVWYSPSAFAEGGYEIPESLEDLTALSDQIVADGGTPWCVGAESGVATGWVLTDWMEDFMLRTHGEDVYDQWISNEMPFNDPRVAEVADAVGAFVKNPDYLGGEGMVKAIATTKFQDGGLPILTGDCYMHRQASFYSGLWGEGVEVGPEADVNFFYLPSPGDGPKYMLGAGDIYAAGTDKPETYDVLRYTGSADYQQQIAETRGELSPHKGVDISALGDPLTQQLSELQASADVFRFDASDLMPGAVGAGTFWTEITAWVIGESTTQEFVDNVQASWPAS